MVVWRGRKNGGEWWHGRLDREEELSEWGHAHRVQESSVVEEEQSDQGKRGKSGGKRIGGEGNAKGGAP